VGKSSVVNLIMLKDLIEVSSSATACTKTTTGYDMPTNSEMPLYIWEIAGFNQPKDGSRRSMENATCVDLATILTRGTRTAVDIVLFCIRGGRTSGITTKVFDLVRELFWGQVPIVVVINIPKNERGSMEEWWDRNKSLLGNLRIERMESVCVTGLRDHSNLKYQQSHEALLKILRNSYATRETKSLESIFGEYIRRNLNQEKKPDKTLMKRYKLDKRTAKRLVASVLPQKPKPWYKLW